jgi:anti-sigma factor RsiW
MSCKKVLPLLSEFFDGVLDDDTSIQVSLHLNQCIRCRKEFNSLSALHDRLRSVERPQAPEYLRSLVQHRLTREPVRVRVRNELERWWSIIRTTETMWYATRALGTAAACVFFLTISTAITPLYMQAGATVSQRDSLTFEDGRQVNRQLGKIFGVPQPMPVKNGRSDPAAINPKYLTGFGENDSGKDEESLSVLAMIDSSGAAKVESVIRSPADETLLTKFKTMLAGARFRPASENGQAVPAPLILTFSRILVSD